jgi:hypothetical protein
MTLRTPIQWVAGALSLGAKRPGRETDHSPPSSAEVKEWVELYLHSPNTPSWCGAQLKHGDNFSFTTEWRYGIRILFFANTTEMKYQPRTTGVRAGRSGF